MSKSRTLMAAAGVAFLATTQAAVAEFAYNPNDLILNFRQTDVPTVDMGVNLGDVADYKTPGSVIPLNQFTVGQLTATFDNLNNLALSVASANADPLVKTLWVTKARTELNTQTTPYPKKNSSSMGTPITKATSIGSNLQTQGSDLSDTVSTIAESNAGSYKSLIGAGNDLGAGYSPLEAFTGTFGANAKVRLDLYEAKPSINTAYLGYIDFNGDGSAVFYAPVPEPATYGLLAGLGILAVSVRQQLRRSQA